MGREPLDSIGYESTYLELRPMRERLNSTADAPILAARPAPAQAYGGAVASNGIAAAAAAMSIDASGLRTIPATPPGLAIRSLHRSCRAGDSSSRRRARELRCGSGADGVPACHRGHQPWLRDSRSWTCLRFGLVVAITAVDVVAELDLHGGLFVPAHRGPPTRLGPADLAAHVACGTIRRSRHSSAGSIGHRARDVLRDRAVGEVRTPRFRPVLEDVRARAVWGLGSSVARWRLPQDSRPQRLRLRLEPKLSPRDEHGHDRRSRIAAWRPQQDSGATRIGRQKLQHSCHASS